MLWIRLQKSWGIACAVLALAMFAVTMLPHVAAAQENPEPSVDSQMWYGHLDAGVRHFRFLLALDHDGDRWSGSLLSLDEGESEFPLDDVVWDGERLEFRIKISSALYIGASRQDGKQIQGNWKQRGADLALDFQRVDSRPEERYAAVWSGTIKVLFQELDVRFRELRSGEVYLDSLTQKAGGFVASKTVDGKKVVFDVPAVKGQFDGQLSEDGKTLTGKWKQGFIPAKLVLTKTEQLPPHKEEPLLRPQTPVAPFPYFVEEVTFENVASNVTLSGTLTIPKDGDALFPAVILVSGSGPQDRDESLMEHKPFWVVADHFSRNGIAVLRFDDRGVGNSTGDFSTANSTDFATDVEAAFRFLVDQEKVDSDAIGICGHSEGGLIAPMVAAQNDKVAFVVMMAGPGVNGEKIVTSQTRLILEASGIEEVEIERQARIQRTFIELAQQTPIPPKKDFEEQAYRAIEVLLSDTEKSSDAGKQMVKLASSQLLNPWFEFFVKYEPAEKLSKLTCPVLAINGERDLQVDPGLNLPVIREALNKAPTEDFEVVELPRLNHLFQECETGLMQEYSQIEETFNVGALELMSDWIVEHTIR